MPDNRRAANTNRKTTSMVSIAYQFIFERDANIWNNIFAFESDIADFFKTNGLEADMVNTVDGSNGLRVIIIRKMPEEDTLVNKKGVDMRNRPGKPSKDLVKGFTNQLAKSFNKQYPGKKGGK